MSVGKGSIERAAKTKGAAEEKKAKEAVSVEEKAAVKETAAKEAPAKKAVKKEGPVAAVSVISSDDIHEKKFEVVSHIYCELPVYLL